MDKLFYLPNPTPIDIIIKLAILGLGCLILWWLVTVLFLQIKGRTKGDLKVDLRSFWATVVVFILLQVYAIVSLNYNLGELGVEAMKVLSFYAQFIPEYLISIALVIVIFWKRKSILRSVDIRKKAESY